ncbi:hypothetical protein PENSPDRAFT_661171 [Peniophora sp. CONT]|nr:hypothetical protein PENSPDRAFT_661171 [Peniophora sp. CONT]
MPIERLVFFLDAEDKPTGAPCLSITSTQLRFVRRSRILASFYVKTESGDGWALGDVAIVKFYWSGGRRTCSSRYISPHDDVQDDEPGYIHQWYSDVRRVDILYIWLNKTIHPRFDARADARYSVKIRLRHMPQAYAGVALAKAIFSIINDVVLERGPLHRPQVIDLAYSIQRRETIAVVLFDDLAAPALDSVRSATQVRITNNRHLVVTRPMPQSVLSLRSTSLIPGWEVVQYLIAPFAWDLRGGGIRGIEPRILGVIPAPEARVLGTPLSDITNRVNAGST